jgi:hypothetical protein
LDIGVVASAIWCLVLSGELVTDAALGLSSAMCISTTAVTGTTAWSGPIHDSVVFATLLVINVVGSFVNSEFGAGATGRGVCVDANSGGLANYFAAAALAQKIAIGCTGTGTGGTEPHEASVSTTSLCTVVVSQSIYKWACSIVFIGCEGGSHQCGEKER